MAAAGLHAAMVAGLSTDIILPGMRPAIPRDVSLLDGTLPLSWPRRFLRDTMSGDRRKPRGLEAGPSCGKPHGLFWGLGRDTATREDSTRVRGDCMRLKPPTHPAVADYDRLPVPLQGRGSEKRLWGQVGGFPQTSQRQTKGSTSLSSGHVRHKAVSTPVWIAAARSPAASWPATTQFRRVPFR